MTQVVGGRTGIRPQTLVSQGTNDTFMSCSQDIKKTYACQKTYKSKGETPLEGIWLRLKNREDGDCGNPFAPSQVRGAEGEL